MAEVNMQRAKEVYESICKTLEDRDWKFDKVEEDLVIKSGIKGEDLPINFIIRVNPENELISLYSWMPFDADESKRVDMALAVCAANFGLLNGSFDYDITDGSITFRLSESYKDSILGPDLFEYMICSSASIIDRYNDKFFMILKDMLSVQDFIASETAGE